MEISHLQTQRSPPNPDPRTVITSLPFLIPAGHAAPSVRACSACAAPGEPGSRSEDPLTEISSQHLHPSDV